MARSQLRHTVTDSAGNVIQNALCNIYLEGTTSPVSDLYAAKTGGSPITTLTSNGQGEVVGYLDVPKNVDIKVTDNTNTAYYPSSPSRLLDWTEFTETLPVVPDVAYLLGASGLPLSDPTGVIDTTTYDNPLGSGKMAVAVFPADTAVTAVAIEGDAFPRFVLAADAGNRASMFFSDGTFDPVEEGAYIAAYEGALYLAGQVGKPVIIQLVAFGNAPVASTPGSVVRKVQVFDSEGASLGFIPVYDIIS